MSYRSLALLVGIGSLFACGDDSPSSVTDASSTGSDSSTSEGPAGDTTGPATPDPATTDSGTTGPAATDSSTTADTAESSTGAPVVCGDRIIEGDEVCDVSVLDGQTCESLGFLGGDLACASDCLSFDTSDCDGPRCGDGVIEGDEVCDGTTLNGATCSSEGFDSGTLACTAECTFDTSDCGICGNFIVESSESCDGPLLLGQTCQTLGFDSGTLGCSADCTALDLSGCGGCGNGVIDGDEVCDGPEVGGVTCADLGMMFDSGTPTCTADCLALTAEACGTCGNGFIDGAEDCEGLFLGGQSCAGLGFDTGVLACLPACEHDTSGCGTCGNGTIDGSEACDGAALGGLTCATLGLTGGALGCTPGCALDTAGCTLPAVPFGADPFYAGVATTPAMLTCDEISLTGTPTGLGGDGHLVVPLGFTFDFYQTPFAEASVGANGTIHFGADAPLGLSNSCFPGNTPYPVDDYIIAAFWDDLDPGAAGEVYTQTLGVLGDQRFVVQWDVPNFAGDIVDLMRIQVVLHQSGAIDVCYPDTINAGNSGDSGAQATAGIQRNANTALSFSCNTPTLVDGLQLRYAPI